MDWAKRFHVKGFPTLILLNASGVEIDRQSGYSPMPDFLRTFQDFERGVGTLADLQERQRSTPGDFSLTMQIARKQIERGQADVAGAALRGILEQDPDNRSDLADEADAELAMMDFLATRQAAALEAVLARWPGVEQGPQIYNILIGSAAKAGEDGRMRELLNQAVSAYPTHVELLNSYAWTSAEKGWDLEKALTMAEEAVRLSNHDLNILDTLAEVQFRMGRADEAAATIRKALERRPKDSYLEGQLQRFLAKP